MKTLNRNDVIVVKDIKTDTIGNHRVSTFLTKIGSARQLATIEKKINDKCTQPIMGRYLVGTDTTEVANRIPTFSIKVCTYKVLKKGNTKSRTFRSKNEAAAYSTGTVSDFQTTVSNILSGSSAAYGETVAGDSVWINPPVQVKGLFHIVLDYSVGAEVDLIRKIRGTISTKFEWAATGRADYAFYKLTMQLPTAARILPIYQFGTLVKNHETGLTTLDVIVPGRHAEEALTNFRKCLISDKGVCVSAFMVRHLDTPTAHLLSSSYNPIVL